ncbi:MAG: hypothetical protein KatS3mg114_0353 [Planctomycetaceae bacterium]|nr:MAG: hypothetical protein KatS3mg114_0353 [Planctomycetaceae bacterium]
MQNATQLPGWGQRIARRYFFAGVPARFRTCGPRRSVDRSLARVGRPVVKCFAPLPRQCRPIIRPGHEP